MIIPGKGHKFIAALGFILLAGSIAAITLYDYQHLGMKVETKTNTQQLSSSASPQLPILLYQPLGNSQEKIYLYKTNPKQKKVKPISTNHSSATVNFTTDQTAKLEIKTSRYVLKIKQQKSCLASLAIKMSLSIVNIFLRYQRTGKSYQSSKLKHYKRSLLNKHCYKNKWY